MRPSQSISAINNFDPDICIKYYEKLKLDHGSPSQTAQTNADWLVNYCLFDQTDRRNKNISFRMNAGVSIGRASQKYVSKYMYEAEKKMLIEKKDLDTIIQEELKEYDKYQAHNEADKEQHEDTKNYLVDMIKIVCNALKDLKLGDEVASERYCTYKFKELALEKIGRIDYEQMNGTKLVELKTKHRSKRKSDTKAGFSWVKGYLFHPHMTF